MDDVGLPAWWHDLDDWVRREREAEVPQGYGLRSSWGPAFELAAPDLGSQRLRTMFKASTHRRLLRRAWLKTPPRGNWDMAHHSGSTTMEGFARTGYFTADRHPT